MEEEAHRAFSGELLQALHECAHVVVVQHAPTVHPPKERLGNKGKAIGITRSSVEKTHTLKHILEFYLVLYQHFLVQSILLETCHRLQLP